MSIRKLKSITRNVVLIVFFVSVASFSLFSKTSYAQLENLLDNLDYSGLSERQIKDEIKLLYKHAKKAYKHRDFETAKGLFYKILELNPNHRAANIYLDEKIPKRLISIDKQEEKSRLKQIKKQEIRGRKQKEKADKIEARQLSIEQTKQRRQELRETKGQEKIARQEAKQERREESADKKQEARRLKIKERLALAEQKQNRLEEARLKKIEAKQNRQEEKKRIVKIKQQKAQEQESKKKDNIRERQLPVLRKYQQRSQAAAQKGKSALINALYEEGYFAYRIGEYAAAKDAFAKILEQDARQIRARDYLNIYIPRLESKLRKQQEDNPEYNL